MTAKPHLPKALECGAASGLGAAAVLVLGLPILKSAALGLNLNSVALGLSLEVRGAGRGVLSGAGCDVPGGSEGCEDGSPAAACAGVSSAEVEFGVGGVAGLVAALQLLLCRPCRQPNVQSMGMRRWVDTGGHMWRV